MQCYSKKTREGGKVVGNFGSDGILGFFCFSVAGNGQFSPNSTILCHTVHTDQKWTPTYFIIIGFSSLASKTWKLFYLSGKQLLPIGNQEAHYLISPELSSCSCPLFQAIYCLKDLLTRINFKIHISYTCLWKNKGFINITECSLLNLSII